MKFSIEKVYSKGSGKFNEDELIATDNLFAVFDGAGSLVKFLSNDGKTGGKIAAETAKKIFSENNNSLKNLAIKTNDSIRELMRLNKIDSTKKENLWCTTVAAVRLINKCAEYFQIGDSLILIISKNGKSNLITDYYDQDKETLIKWKKLRGRKCKEIWKILQSQFIKIRKKQNIDYGILNGEKKAIKFFNVGRFSLNNIRYIIIFTDGLLLPKKDPKDNENWKEFARLYEKFGLKGLLRYIRSVENRDSECSDYPRFKKHDDIAAVVIKIINSSK